MATQNTLTTWLHEDDRRCWYCGCKTIIWQEKERSCTIRAGERAIQ